MTTTTITYFVKFDEPGTYDEGTTYTVREDGASAWDRFYVHTFDTLAEAAEWVQAPRKRCTAFEVHPDGFGLACSEPDVPTYIEVGCTADATRRIVVQDEQQPAYSRDTGYEDTPDAYYFCSEHADALLADIHSGEYLGARLISVTALDRTTSDAAL